MLPFLLAVMASNNKELNEDFKHSTIPYMDSLYNFALKLTGKKNAANKILKLTYVNAFKFWNFHEPGANCKAWLFNILKYSLKISFKKYSEDSDKTDSQQIEEYYKKIKPLEPNSKFLQRENYNNIQDDQLSEAILSLPENLKTVLILSDIIGFTYDEISDYIDVPVGTICSRLYHARKVLFTKIYNYSAAKD